jgi:hypothetical protein
MDGSLLLACLLLLARLLACPSPPGLAPGPSPPGLVLSFNWPPWFCGMYLSDEVQELVLFLVWFAKTLVFLRWCSIGSVCGCFPWCSSPGRLLALLAAVVLPAQASHAVTKLLVSCLSPWLDLILTWPYCELLCVHLTCTPVVLKIRYYTWSIKSMMQWQNHLP